MVTRSLVIEGTKGDATLRSFMNWEAIKSILKHKKHCCIGKIRSIQKNHPSVGAGIHKQISAQPYTFPELFLKKIIRIK
jgi:alpha-amylase